MELRRDDEIIAGSLVTYDGGLVNEMVKNVTASKSPASA